MSFLSCASGEIVGHKSSRSHQDTNAQSLISKAPFHIEKTPDTVDGETPKRYRKSLSVVYLVSASSMSRQVLPNLKCHEIRKGKLEERKRLKYQKKTGLNLYQKKTKP